MWNNASFLIKSEFSALSTYACRDINDVKIAEVTTTSGLQRINIVCDGSLVTKMKNCEYNIIDDKHLLIFYTTAILKKVDILLTRECICHDIVF